MAQRDHSAVKYFEFLSCSENKNVLSFGRKVQLYIFHLTTLKGSPSFKQGGEQRWKDVELERGDLATGMSEDTT